MAFLEFHKSFFKIPILLPNPPWPSFVEEGVFGMRTQTLSKGEGAETSQSLLQDVPEPLDTMTFTLSFVVRYT